MSAGLPYIAPWQAAFERYSVQTFTPSAVGIDTMQLVIPDGQWWRIIYLSVVFAAGAAAATRTQGIRVLDKMSNQVFQQNAPTSQLANTTFAYTAGPGQTSYFNTAGGQAVYALPDVLWPPLATVQSIVFSAAVGDAYTSTSTFAVEIYGETRPGVLAPVLTATPLLA